MSENLDFDRQRLRAQAMRVGRIMWTVTKAACLLVLSLIATVVGAAISFSGFAMAVQPDVVLQPLTSLLMRAQQAVQIHPGTTMAHPEMFVGVLRGIFLAVAWGGFAGSNASRRVIEDWWDSMPFVRKSRETK